MTDSPDSPSSKRDLVSGSLVANLTRLALPLAAGMVLHNFYGLADALWLGRHSKEALAAPSVSMPFFWFVISFGMGFGSAGTALVSQLTGAGRHHEADRAAGQVLTFLTAIAAGLAVPLVFFAPTILRLAQVPPEVSGGAVPYFRIAMAAMPLMAFNIAYGAVLRALGDTMTIVVIGGVTNLLNAALDPLFIFGWAGVPAMGAPGAAVATVISQAVFTLACIVLLRRGHSGLRLRMSDLVPDAGLLKKTASIGLPAALGNSSSSLGFLVFQVMINRLGTAVISAFLIGHRIIHFLNVPSQALALSAAPVVGQALGAGKPSLARRAVSVSAGVVAVGMLVPFAILMWRGQWVASFFNSEADVISQAGRFFLIVPASSYFFGVIMVLMAAFYGSGHTKPALGLSLLRLWVLRLPLGYLLGFVLGMGSTGVYMGMVVGNVISAGLLLWLFRRGRWLSSVVGPAADGRPRGGEVGEASGGNGLKRGTR